MKHRLVLILVAACPLLLSAATARAKSASEVFESVNNSVVVVKSFNSKGESLGFGSGVALPAGVVATNCHVIKGAASLRVLFQGTEYPATTDQSDWERDVCTLSAATLPARAVVMGSSRGLKVGQRVYAVGAPRGLELTLSDGIVSSLRPVSRGQYIQTTAAISPGSSGGGLFDEEGQLVGLPSFFLTEGQQLNFAVPVEWLTELTGSRPNQEKVLAGSATGWLGEAVALDRKKDWDGLLRHALLWTAKEPKDLDALNYLGRAYLKSGQYAKAILSYRKSLSRVPDAGSDVWYNLGLAYSATNEMDKAIAAYQRAIKSAPDSAEVWNSLGEAFAQTKQTAKAIDAFQQALRLAPDLAAASFNLGNTYKDSGQAPKAIEAYRRAIRSTPDNAETWNNLGDAYSAGHQTDDAIAAYQRAIQINPGHYIASYNLGNAFTAVKQPVKAIEAYRQALKLNQYFAYAWINLGNVYYSTNQIDKAIEAYQQAIRSNPEYVEAWFNLGRAEKLSGRHAKVVEVYERLKSINPAKADLFYEKVLQPSPSR
jgi:tetratricopeptide (TPR) repeat protein